MDLYECLADTCSAGSFVKKFSLPVVTDPDTPFYVMKSQTCVQRYPYIGPPQSRSILIINVIIHI